MSRPVLVWLVLSACSSVSHGSKQDREPAANIETARERVVLPASWNVEEIARATPPFATEGKVDVLAWKIIENTGFRVESCVAVRVLEHDDGFGRWAFVQLYRRPDEPKPEWRTATTHVSGEPGTKYFPGLMLSHDKRFTSRPRNQDVYASFDSVEELHWSFDAGSGFELVGCGIDEARWRDMIGESPTRMCGRISP